MSSLGDRLKVARERKGILQKFVAEKLGISAPTLAGYEGGYRTPSPELVGQLAELYDVPISYLITGEHPVYQATKDAAIDIEKLFDEMDVEFQGVKLKESMKEQLKDMMKFMIWDDIQKSKKKPD